MRDQFGARVMFPSRSGDDDPEVVTIIGRKEKVEGAKNHLEKLIKELVRLVCVHVCVCVNGGSRSVCKCSGIAW